MSFTINDYEKHPIKKTGDVLGRLFQRPFFLSFTIGIPFCLFRLLFGVIAIRIGTPEDLFS